MKRGIIFELDAGWGNAVIMSGIPDVNALIKAFDGCSRAETKYLDGRMYYIAIKDAGIKVSTVTVCTEEEFNALEAAFKQIEEAKQAKVSEES